MSDGTKIEWTDATWNPKSVFFGRAFNDVQCHESALDQPMHCKKGRKIFVCPRADLFHDDVPFEFIDRVFAVMALAKQHTFQVLTKRPERMRDYMLRLGNSAKLLDDAARTLGYTFKFQGKYMVSWPISNIWLGVSVEDQAAADVRIPLLLDTPAAIRWISAEPLLGPVDISDHLWGRANPCEDCPQDADCDCGFTPRHKVTLEPALHWVVVGGESGLNARPMHPDWARDLRDQCEAAGVPFFMKQLSGEHGKTIKDISAFPVDLQVREYPQ